MRCIPETVNCITKMMRVWQSNLPADQGNDRFISQRKRNSETSRPRDMLIRKQRGNSIIARRLFISQPEHAIPIF